MDAPEKSPRKVNSPDSAPSGSTAPRRGRGRPTKFDWAPDWVRDPQRLSSEQVDAFMVATRLVTRVTFDACKVAYPELDALARRFPGSIDVSQIEAQRRAGFDADLRAWARGFLATFPEDADGVQTLNNLPDDVLCYAFAARTYNKRDGEGGSTRAALEIGPARIEGKRSKYRGRLERFPSAAKYLALPVGIALVPATADAATAEAATAASGRRVGCYMVSLLALPTAVVLWVVDCDAPPSSAPTAAATTTTIDEELDVPPPHRAASIQSAASVPVPVSPRFPSPKADSISSAWSNLFGSREARGRPSTFGPHGPLDSRLSLHGFYVDSISARGEVVVRAQTAGQAPPDPPPRCEGRLADDALVVWCYREPEKEVGTLAVGWLVEEERERVRGVWWRVGPVEGISVYAAEWCMDTNWEDPKCGVKTCLVADDPSVEGVLTKICAAHPTFIPCSIESVRTPPVVGAGSIHVCNRSSRLSRRKVAE